MAVMQITRKGVAYDVLVDDHLLEPLQLMWRWRILKSGYVLGRHRFDRRRRESYLHRVVLNLQYGDGLQADHRNHEKLDNRRENLRRCTAAENLKNRRPSNKPCRKKTDG